MYSHRKSRLTAFLLTVAILSAANAQTANNTSGIETAKTARPSPLAKNETAGQANQRERAGEVATNLSPQSVDVAPNVMPVPGKSGLQFGDESGWEIYLGGGGSFWSGQDVTTTLREVFTLTPNQPLPADKFQIRQSFASGGRLEFGVVKNINRHSAIEFTYGYSTSNFRLSVFENPFGIANGETRSLGLRSHTAAINYRYSPINNEQARFYLTGGFNLTVFNPTNDGLDRLFGYSPDDLSDFKEKPNFRTVAAPGINVGAGIIVKATDLIGFRFDVRDYMTFTRKIKGSTEFEYLGEKQKVELQLPRTTLHNLVPTFGVVFTPK